MPRFVTTPFIAFALAAALAACAAPGTGDAPDAAPASEAAPAAEPTTDDAPATDDAPEAAPETEDATADALQSALADVGRVAPALESFYRGGDYPRELDAVIASLDAAGLELSTDNSLGSYRYDAAAVEFELCVEHVSGAFATYDTAPMSTRATGETGGCPEL